MIRELPASKRYMFTDRGDEKYEKAEATLSRFVYRGQLIDKAQAPGPAALYDDDEVKIYTDYLDSPQLVLSQAIRSLHPHVQMSSHTDVLLAGGFAAFVVDLLVYPLDTLKTRIQAPNYKQLYYGASRNAINRKLLFRGLYQGVGPIILITIPSSAAFFTTYEAIKSLLSKANPILTGSTAPLIPQPLIHSAASATAELVSCFILTPAEVLKQNAQMIRKPTVLAHSKSSTILQSSVTLQALKQFNRPSQLWRGYTALAFRNLPFTAMQFPMFEALRERIKKYRKDSGTYTGTLLETGTITAISAGSAGSLAAWITTPIDVIKTRIMLSASGQGSEESAAKDVEKARLRGRSLSELVNEKGGTNKSGLTIAREVMQDHGVKGLFRGAGLRAAWTALGSGLYLGVYESGRVWLGHHNEDSR